MKFFIFFIFLFPLLAYGLDISLWNKTLTQTSGPKDCPQGNLTGNQNLKLARLGERAFLFVDGAPKVEMTNVPGCEETSHTTFDITKNELIRKAKVTKCVQPTDDKEYTETLRVNLGKKTVKYFYHHKKTKTLEKKFICRYSYR